MNKRCDRSSSSRGSLRSGLGVIVISALVCAGCGSANDTASLVHRHVLSVADLPEGWSAAPTAATTAAGPCFSGLSSSTKGLTYARAGFVQGTAIPTLGEELQRGEKAQQRWQSLDRELSRCRATTIRLGSTKVVVRIRPLALPRVGERSAAYRWAFTLSGVRIGIDLVLFQARSYVGYLVYADLGAPQLGIVRAFIDAAVTKATTGQVVRIPDTISITSTPVRTTRTSLGTVAYRTVGAGPPLVLITGYGGTMEDWDRRFVDALAEHHRVVIFDNAGVGRTQTLPAPLTIDAMANQTSALINALRLGPSDVLGWSMGSMIAQALAVLHPGQVRRLILSASYPGDGTAIRPTQSAINALSSGNEQHVMADLYPAGQSGAADSYLTSLSSYPAAPPAPAAIVTSQGDAVKQWWNGQDPAGERTGTITVPTLIADGTQDELDPLTNSQTLARVIPGAKLELYPDAGHAFLFQDQTSFIPLIESFLG